MTIRLHRGDLPDLERYPGAVAIDTETMGLDPRRDRLCVVQLSPGDGSADIVQIPQDLSVAPNLVSLLTDSHSGLSDRLGTEDVSDDIPFPAGFNQEFGRAVEALGVRLLAADASRENQTSPRRKRLLRYAGTRSMWRQPASAPIIERPGAISSEPIPSGRAVRTSTAGWGPSSASKRRIRPSSGEISLRIRS